jgi:phytoene synthase
MEIEAAYAHCAAEIRAHDPDRFFASLFAPADKRPHLHALYAFSLEIARVREVARQPIAGEIRLQWWREALSGAGRGDVAAHPVAAALLDTMSRFGLPPAPFLALIEARTFDLYDDPMPDVATLEGYAGETASVLFRLASLTLADGSEAGPADAAGHAGVAYAITGLLRALPWHARAGQLYLPGDVLARHGVTREDIIAGRDSPALRAALAEMRALARAHLTKALRFVKASPAVVRPAFLPLAVVPLYLRRMERRDKAPFTSIVDVQLWWRLWALWRAARV